MKFAIIAAAMAASVSALRVNQVDMSGDALIQATDDLNDDLVQQTNVRNPNSPYNIESAEDATGFEDSDEDNMLEYPMALNDEFARIRA